MSTRLLYRISIIIILTSLILLGVFMISGEMKNKNNQKKFTPEDNFAFCLETY